MKLCLIHCYYYPDGLKWRLGWSEQVDEFTFVYNYLEYAYNTVSVVRNTFPEFILEL